MSYQVLARKYRPKNFTTLVGQEHVVRALSHALDQQRLHHAYLFTGTRGVGKTTLSRILAKSFNCEKGITSNPCGDCDTCVAIDAGRFVDYIEMDAASNRGVDEMAALLEQAIYAPSNARFKVYMIDEVHMLTNHAFNAMLKTLEEPPAHVKFILATTDPQKIPMTVLSRCLQFNLKQMPPGHIISHLDHILGQEKIEFEVPALRLLAQGAHGSMRDALSLTDQAIAYAAGKVTLDAVQSMLGALDQSYLIRLLDALVVEDGKALLDIADEMAARSLSYKAALQDLGTLLNQLAIAQLAPTALGEELPERAELLRLATNFSKEEVQLFYQIVVHGRNEIGLAPDEYAGFTMTLLRMLAFRPSSVNEQLGQHGNVSANKGTPKASHQSAPHQSANLLRPSPVVQTSTVPHHSASSAHVQAPLTSTVSSQTVTQSMAAAKPLSPAMAALAAARAGSNRPAQQNPSLPAHGATAFVKDFSVVATTISAEPAPVLMAMKPNAINILPVESGKVVQGSDANDHEILLPWDDEDLTASTEVALHTHHHEQDMDIFSEASVFPTDANPEVISNSINSTSKEINSLILMPIPQLDWDGHWPNLAASLPVRGVAQQLAQQSELKQCTVNGNVITFKLCVPLQTLLSSGSLDKLILVLNEKFQHFAYDIRIETEIGVVEQTANAQANAERAERLVQAEKNIQSDSFVQALIRDFGASILTGSIQPL